MAIIELIRTTLLNNRNHQETKEHLRIKMWQVLTEQFICVNKSNEGGNNNNNAGKVR